VSAVHCPEEVILTDCPTQWRIEKNVHAKSYVAHVSFDSLGQAYYRVYD
jgi:hypothetical protein